MLLLACMPLSAFESKAKWIWRPGDKAEYGEQLLIRKEINLEAAPTEGFFNVLGDDTFTLFLNGEQLFKQSGFIVHKIDARKLKAGKNVVAAVIKNDKDIAGLLIYGELKVNNKKMTFLTDTSWKVHSPSIINQKDWKLPGYDDSKWQNAIVMSGVTTQNVWKQFVKPELFLSAEELAVIKAEDLQRKNAMQNAMLEAENGWQKNRKSAMPNSYAAIMFLSSVSMTAKNCLMLLFSTQFHILQKLTMILLINSNATVKTALMSLPHPLI